MEEFAERQLEGARGRTAAVRRGISSRVVAIVLASGSGLVTTAIVTRHLDVAEFGWLSLIIAMPMLVPFADLGIGTAVTNLVAQASNEIGRARAMAAIRRSIVLLSVSSLLMLASMSVVTLCGWWPALLGIENGHNGVVASALVVGVAFASSLPVSVGDRVLLGLHRPATSNFILASRWVCILTGSAVVAVSPQSGSILAYAVVHAVCLIGAALTSFLMAAKYLSSHGWPKRGSSAGFDRNLLRSHAVPTLVGTVAFSLTYQSDRIVISHVLDAADLAIYSLAASFYAPAYSIVVAVGMSAWPAIASARASGDGEWSMRLIKIGTGLALLVGITGAGAFAVIGPAVGEVLANGRISTPSSLYGAFGILLALQLFPQFAIGGLMHPSGLRLQACCMVAVCVAGVPLSVMLASIWGAAGPVWASVIVTGCLYSPILVVSAWRGANVVERVQFTK